jgi:hypothetical protein
VATWKTDKEFMAPKRIIFFSNQLGLRGTEIALFDYAKYNQDILGNQSIVFAHEITDGRAYKKFKKEFDVVISPSEVSLLQDLRAIKPDLFYKICAGKREKNSRHTVPCWHTRSFLGL